MQSVVKKWFKDKNFGFIENGAGPDILVRKPDLVNCAFLRVGATVEFECHPDKKGLVAKQVKLKREQQNDRQGGQGGGQGGQGGYGGNRSSGGHYFGVMT